MNWLGELVQKEITPNDTVLNLGAGIMPELSDLKCKELTCVEIFEPYVNWMNAIGINAICADVTKWKPKKKYDVVLALDLVEHLEKKEAIKLIENMKHWAKKVIIYTPSKFYDNKTTTHDGKKMDVIKWLDTDVTSPYSGFGENSYMEHKCLITIGELERLGFDTKIIKPDGNIYAMVKT